MMIQFASYILKVLPIIEKSLADAKSAGPPHIETRRASLINGTYSPPAYRHGWRSCVRFSVAFALPGSAIITIGLAAVTGEIVAGDASAYFAQGGPVNWLTAGVTNFRGVYWEVERDT